MIISRAFSCNIIHKVMKGSNMLLKFGLGWLYFGYLVEAVKSGRSRTKSTKSSKAAARPVGWQSDIFVLWLLPYLFLTMSYFDRTSYLLGMKRQYTPMAFQQWIWRDQMQEMLAMHLEVVCSGETLLERESSSKVICYE